MTIMSARSVWDFKQKMYTNNPTFLGLTEW
jgi:hypothetical protein